MKRCYRCQELKPASDYNRSAKTDDGLHSYCRDCQKAHYESNKPRHRRNVRRVTVERLKRDRIVIAEALSGGCVDCGFSDIRALDFDHVRGEKVANVGALVRLGRPIEVIVAEIAKCEVRCRNCHAIVTSQRRARDWHDDYL